MLRKFLIWLLIFAVFITLRGLANSYKDSRAMTPTPIISGAEANSSGDEIIKSYEINNAGGDGGCFFFDWLWGLIVLMWKIEMFFWELVSDLLGFLFGLLFDLLGAVCSSACGS